MNTLVITILSLIGYILAYRLYGRFLGKKLFRLTAETLMPSHELRDNVDYVPTNKRIIFGHHFTTIAGLGPIVGPAIGIIWGWLPALLWIFLGSIFMGAVHDLSALVISARNKGKSIGDLAGIYISPGTRLAFQFLMQLLLFIVLAVFASIVATLFVMYPVAVVPVWLQIPIAVWLGWQLRRGRNEWIYSGIAVLALYATMLLGVMFPVVIPGEPNFVLGAWCILLFIYVSIASVLPVQVLLQPRDFINSYQLIVAMGIMFLGILIAHPVLSAPAVNPAAFAEGSDVPSLAPVMFIVIACGAISGFHSLASSGTTVKQVDKEEDSLFIAYGSMLTESFLAVLVLMAIGGGLGIGLISGDKLLTGVDAFNLHYQSWNSANGLSSNLEAFITGTSNLFAAIGIPQAYAQVMIAVFIVSFANTTLDSATRIQRLSFQEIMKRRDGSAIKPFSNRFLATFIVVLAAAIMSFLKPGGKGAMVLWPLFGSLNQLLAALALGIVTIYLFIKKINVLYTLIPMVFVLIVTVWAMAENLFSFAKSGDLILTVLSTVILILTAWLLGGGIRAVFLKLRNRV
jgi:carbon starvation protein